MYKVKGISGKTECVPCLNSQSCNQLKYSYNYNRSLKLCITSMRNLVAIMSKGQEDRLIAEGLSC